MIRPTHHPNLQPIPLRHQQSRRLPRKSRRRIHRKITPQTVTLAAVQSCPRRQMASRGFLAWILLLLMDCTCWMDRCFRSAKVRMSSYRSVIGSSTRRELFARVTRGILRVARRARCWACSVHCFSSACDWRALMTVTAPLAAS